VHLVVEGGVVHEPGDLVPATPEAVVQRQLNAYNARELDRFVATYAPNVEAFEHPATPVFSGIDALRRDYAEYFARVRELHCELVNRMVLGDRVLDHERVSGDGEPFEAVAIYEVRDGLIRKVWFVAGPDAAAD
jgi:hypothetical protein